MADPGGRGAAIVRARRVEYLLYATYLLPPVLFGFGALMWYLAGFFVGVALLIQGVVTLSVPLILRSTDSTELAGHTFIASFILGMAYLAAFTGGLESPAILPLVVSGPLGILVLSRSGAAFWAVAGAVALAIGAWAALSGFEFPWALEEGALSWIRSISIVSVMAVLFLLLLRYQHSLDSAVVEVSAANDKMRHAGREISAAGRALADTTTAFAGGADAGGLAQEMVSGATQGRRAVEEARERLELIFSQYREIDSRVRQQSSRTAIVIEQIDNIDRIGSQLDLMALNIGIEAASAGDKGRGFSVLADDMRRLAERVSDETQAIKGTLHEIKNLSVGVDEATTRGAKLTRRGDDDVKLLAKSFEEVLALVDRAARVARATTVQAREQLVAIQHLVEVDDDQSS